ncbi:TPA: PD-(D/E)XK nuclease superfamily protein [Photobacterium damselae]
MCRKDLLGEISNILTNFGFTQSNSEAPMTYQSNVKYPSIFAGKSDHAHFIVHMPNGTIQIVAKYQESVGTAMEKLGYTAFDAERTEHDAYLVVCGGKELLRGGRAIDFLNEKRCIAPKLQALTVRGLSDYLANELSALAA